MKGCDPRKYAKSKAPIPLFILCGVKLHALRKNANMANLRIVFVRLVQKPERGAISSRALFGR